jgi:hypothetical protein
MEEFLPSHEKVEVSDGNRFVMAANGCYMFPNDRGRVVATISQIKANDVDTVLTLRVLRSCAAKSIIPTYWVTFRFQSKRIILNASNELVISDNEGTEYFFQLLRSKELSPNLDQVSFRSHNGKFLSVKANGKITAGVSKIGASEKFEVSGMGKTLGHSMFGDGNKSTILTKPLMSIKPSFNSSTSNPFQKQQSGCSKSLKRPEPTKHIPAPSMAANNVIPKGPDSDKSAVSIPEALGSETARKAADAFSSVLAEIMEESQASQRKLPIDTVVKPILFFRRDLLIAKPKEQFAFSSIFSRITANPRVSPIKLKQLLSIDKIADSSIIGKQLANLNFLWLEWFDAKSKTGITRSQFSTSQNHDTVQRNIISWRHELWNTIETQSDQEQLEEIMMALDRLQCATPDMCERFQFSV